MKTVSPTRRHFLYLLKATTLGAALPLRAQQASGWQSLFDGRALTGWKATALSIHSNVSGIFGEGIWKRPRVRNYSFGSSSDVITLLENKEHRCPELPESWKYFWVNGVQIMQHTEPARVQAVTGHIGLQWHGGTQFADSVRYRNIHICQL